MSNDGLLSEAIEIVAIERDIESAARRLAPETLAESLLNPASQHVTTSLYAHQGKIGDLSILTIESVSEVIDQRFDSLGVDDLLWSSL